jgi:hypothetical protein
MYLMFYFRFMELEKCDGCYFGSSPFCFLKADLEKWGPSWVHRFALSVPGGGGWRVRGPTQEAAKVQSV